MQQSTTFLIQKLIQYFITVNTAQITLPADTKLKHKEWITPALIKSINFKQKSYVQARIQPDDHILQKNRIIS